MNLPPWERAERHGVYLDALPTEHGDRSVAARRIEGREGVGYRRLGRNRRPQRSALTSR